jgi:hypothetical protein
VTALEFALAVRRELFPGHARAGWLLFDGVLHGWPLVIANLALCAWWWWAAFWIIYRGAGRERLFMAGWFADFLFWPVRVLEPRWAEPVRLIGIAGLAFALMIAVWLLLRPMDIEIPADGLDVRQSH